MNISYKRIWDKFSVYLSRTLKFIFFKKNVDARDFIVYILGTKFVLRRRNVRIYKPQDEIATIRSLPINREKILFRSDRNNYSCNTKYIAEEILRRNLPWELVWIVDKNILHFKDDFPAGIRLEMIGTDEALHDSMTARILIDNTYRRYLLNHDLQKKTGQVYIQTWRGSYGIKKFGLGRNNFNVDTWNSVLEDIKQMDYFISHSTWESNFYRRTFRAKKILELGHPRNDIFFRKDVDTIRRKVCEKLDIPTNKRLVLYAPTRNDNRPRKVFNMDYSAVLAALKNKFGGEWVMAARMTPLANRERFITDDLGIINVSNYADIQELLVTADVCISDYSSCIFDYLHTGRPAFIYASDHASFERSRGLYYPLAQTPFQIAENNEQMLNNIRSFNSEVYSRKISPFLKEKGSMEDGCAAKRVVDLLQKLIK